MAAKTGNNYCSETLTDSVEIPTPNSGFSMTTNSIKDEPNDCDKDRLLEIARLTPKTSILLFPVVDRCRNRPGSVFRAGRGRKLQICRWKCHPICHSSRDKYFRFWWPYRYFRLSFDIIVTCGHFLRACPGRKPQVCRRNCSDICHTVGDISTSGLDGHIAISRYPSMLHLFVDTFFEFCVVENFACRARITVILRPTSDLFGSMSM